MPQPRTNEITERIEDRSELSSWTYAAFLDAIEAALNEWGREETEATFRRVVREKVA